MRLSRRTVLAGGSAFSLSLAGPRAVGQTGARTLFVLFEDLQKTAVAPVARQVVHTFLENGIPVCIGLENVDVSDGSGFLEFIGEIAVENPGLIEVAPGFRPAEDAHRYFQLRAASDLRRRIAHSALGRVMGDQVAKIVTVVERSERNHINPYAFRGAGFRVQLRVNSASLDEAAGQTSVSSPDWGILEIDGAMPVTIDQDPRLALESILAGNGPLLLAISLGGTVSTAAGAGVTGATAWANALRDSIQEGRVFVTRPSDHVLQGNPGASKYLALMLDLRSGPSPGMNAFMAELDGSGFAYSTLLPGPAWQSGAASACYSQDGLEQTALPTCVLDSSWPSPEVLGVSQIILVPGNSPNVWTGLRDDARVQVVVNEAEPGSFAERHEADPMTDQVDLISPDQVATDLQRRAILRGLDELRRDGRAHFYSIEGFVNQIVAPEPALERLWSLRRRRASDPLRMDSPADEARGRYLEDARLAWRFIEKFTDDDTGLCLGTVSPRDRSPSVTLWDVASQLFGILSAARLDLITIEEAKRRTDLLLGSLPSHEIDGLRLPPAVFRADTLGIVNPGFDACDTGRFLLALDAVSAAGVVARNRSRDLLKTWDLQGTIREGHVFNHDRNRWFNATENHCTPYTASGFAAWGLDIASSYPSIGKDPSGDDLMRLLHKAAFLGPFGAEPLLLEAVERQQSSESRFLSDVLFDAQVTWFEQTGEFKGVSEAPLNFAPWFIYQGLRVDRLGRQAWSIRTKSSLSVYGTAEFMEKAELISTKSAFLWAATHPHEYTDRVMALVRDKTPIADNGFSVGIFARTNQPVEGYSDLNTNGIILTAIARILLGAPD